MGKLDNKVALITGGASGIGKATALLFAKEGAKVAIADWAEDNGKTVAKQITDNGGAAIAIKTDITKAADAERMVAETVRRFGRLDIIYNNAGIGNAKPVHEMTEEEWLDVMRERLKGTRIFACWVTFQWYWGSQCVCPKCGKIFQFTIEMLKSGKYNVEP